MFNHAAELAIHIRISTKETKAEIKTHPVIKEAEISMSSI